MTDKIMDKDLTRRGDLTSDNHRPASTCNDCRETWYAQAEPSYCPNCGSGNVEKNGELPGALLLNPGVDWPTDDPFVGDGGD